MSPHRRSNEDDLPPERDLVGAVKESFSISDRTKIKFTIGGVVAVCVTIVGSTIGACNYVNDFRNNIDTQFTELKRSQDKMTAALSYKLSTAQWSEWTRQLDDQNRDLQRTGGKQGLVVPPLLPLVSNRNPLPPED